MIRRRTWRKMDKLDPLSLSKLARISLLVYNNFKMICNKYLRTVRKRRLIMFLSILEISLRFQRS